MQGFRRLVVVFSCSVMSNTLQPHGLQHTRLTSPSLSLWSLLRFMSIVSMMPFNHPSLCHPSPAINLPSIRVFSNELALHIRWPKHWSFSISPSNGFSELISFRIDWFILPSKGLSRVFSSTTVWKHQFFNAQLCLWSKSYPYMTTGKTIALTVWTFVSKVMSPLVYTAFNTLSRFVIVFLPRSKQMSFNFMVAITICSDFRTQENKVCHCFHFFPIYLPWSDGTGCHDLSFWNAEF